MFRQHETTERAIDADALYRCRLDGREMILSGRDAKHFGAQILRRHVLPDRGLGVVMVGTMPSGYEVWADIDDLKRTYLKSADGTFHPQFGGTREAPGKILGPVSTKTPQDPNPEPPPPRDPNPLVIRDRAHRDEIRASLGRPA